MAQPGARAALVPLTSSPRRLFAAAGAIIAAVVLIQTVSGVPHWRDLAPIELSSNVVAVMGMAWAAIELRTYWPNAGLRTAWIAALVGMTVLAIDGDVVELVIQTLTDEQEMNVSIALWLCAAALIFFASRRFAFRHYATLAIGAGFGLQMLAQYAGWLSVGGNRIGPGAEVAAYLNDLGELAAALAYLSGLLLAEFAPIAVRPTAPAFAPPAARPLDGPSAEVVSLSRFRRSVVRCVEAGVAFPQLFRVTGFAWREADDGPERGPHVAYVFDENDLAGLEEAQVSPADRPDPALDRGGVLVRHHRSAEAAGGYLDAVRDLDEGSDVRVLHAPDGVFTLIRPAHAPDRDGRIAYAARVPQGAGEPDALWTLAIGRDGREVTVRPARDTPERDAWVD